VFKLVNFCIATGYDVSVCVAWCVCCRVCVLQSVCVVVGVCCSERVML